MMVGSMTIHISKAQLMFSSPSIPPSQYPCATVNYPIPDAYSYSQARPPKLPILGLYSLLYSLLRRKHQVL
ncbi:hypothetical protein K439DRAFT_1078653 [Ramaria rubella]|nr:hypothetical protein K439DRAFT_1078653 [Ramaria rubella]